MVRFIGSPSNDSFRKMVDADNGSIGQRRRPLDDVVELSDIPWPRIPFQERQRGWIECRCAVGLGSTPGREAPEKRLRQHLHIALSFPKRRQHDRDDVEPIVQIFAELLPSTSLLEVAVGRAGDQGSGSQVGHHIVRVEDPPTLHQTSKPVQQ
jgi:hypothetical protein